MWLVELEGSRSAEQTADFENLIRKEDTHLSMFIIVITHCDDTVMDILE